MKIKLYGDFERVVENDIIIFGAQEIIEVKSKNYKKFLFGAQNEYDEMASFLESQLVDFEIFGRFFNGANGIFVLVRKSRKRDVDLLICRNHKINLGFMGLMANKTVVGVELFINQTKFLFFNGHLAAGESPGDFEKRKRNLETLRKYLGEFLLCLYYSIYNYIIGMFWMI